MSKQNVVDEIFRPTRRNYPTRKVVIKGINDLYQADLIDLTSYKRYNNKFTFILLVINTFSKKVYGRSLKTKSAVEVASAFESILKTLPRIFKYLHVDEGKEFYNSKFKDLMLKYGIKMYSTFSGKKASIIERTNRTIMGRIYKKMYYSGSFKWTHHLQPVIDNYNNTIHRTIKMKPNQVKPGLIEKNLLKTVYKPMISSRLPKYKVGDIVRISKTRRVFEKGYLAKYSTELFRIKNAYNSVPVTYILEDLSGELIQGRFYEEELMMTKYPNIYLIEKIIKKHKNGTMTVKWLGFDSPSVIDATDIIE